MLALALRYWKEIAAALGASALSVALMWVMWGVSDAAHAAAFQKELASVTSIERKACAEAQAKAEEASHDYQVSVAALNDRLNRLKRVQSRCIALAGEGSSRPDAASRDEGLSGGNGIRTEWLYDFAGRCEQTARQLDSLQNFTRKVEGD